ncbi:MAG: hypothetical protein H6742_19850 [Alphaproteobacteria bacterium]|nr:hypothetical protein [Alphaproteobacteria bacterium]
MKPLHEALALCATSLLLRVAAAWALGQGAPFGPDGTGVEASVHLPGHPYPLHVAMVAALGSARTVSVLAGALTSPLLWLWGRRVGLGGVGGWLHAALPVAVLTGALSAGDAPAAFVVTAGLALSTAPRRPVQALGGVLAVAALAVKPIALPLLVLLVVRPWALLGAVLALPLAARWLTPLLQPIAGGGLLGSWWLGSQGAPPAVDALPGWLATGVHALGAAELWALAPLLVLAVAAAARDLPRGLRLAAAGPLVAGLAVACLMGDRVEPRYLGGAVIAALPFVGALVRWRSAALLLLPLSVALVTQLGAERARRDAGAVVPALPVLPWPAVGAGELFAQCSTDDATVLRQTAARLAETLPPGAEIQVVRRRDGREGELSWPLQVARPDVVVTPVPEGTDGAY